MAPVYMLITRLLAGNATTRTQRLLLDQISAGDRVLTVGCGPGPFNVDLARSGAQVTYIDIAPEMVSRARARVEAQLGTTHDHVFLAADLMTHQPDQPYDVIIAAFVLNTFAWPDCCRVIEQLVGLAGPDGRICVADEGRSASRLTAAFLDLARKPTLFLYGLLTGQPVHGLYDYDPVFAALGWQVADRRRDVKDYFVATTYRSKDGSA